MRPASFAIGALLVFSVGCGDPPKPNVQVLNGHFTGARDSVGLSLTLAQDDKSITGTGTLVVGLYSLGVTVSGAFEPDDSSFTLALSGGSGTAVFNGNARETWGYGAGALLRGVLSGLGGPASYSMAMYQNREWPSDGRLTFTQETLWVHSGVSEQVTYNGGANWDDPLYCENCGGRLGSLMPVTFRIRNPALVQNHAQCADYYGDLECDYYLTALGPLGNTWVVATAGGIGAPTDSIVVSIVPGYPASADFIVQPTSTRVNTAIVPFVQVGLRDGWGNRTREFDDYGCIVRLALLPGGSPGWNPAGHTDSSWTFVVSVSTAGAAWRLEARTVKVSDSSPCRYPYNNAPIAWDTSAMFPVAP